MKARCCNCGFVSEIDSPENDSSACKKCGSRSFEALVPHQRQKNEGRSARGRLLLEVPASKDDLMG
jgi:predicted  nucleic acid-binding Zn-ribbon protein